VSIEASAGNAALPPGALRPPPALVLPNDGDLSYCKIRFDPQSWSTVTSSLGGIGDPLSRAVIWNAARDLVRDGELPGREYLGLAARHLPAETDTSIVAQVLGFARGPVADRYLPPELRGAALHRIAGICEDLLSRASGGDADGLRLAAIRGLIDSATQPVEIAGLRSWLAAGELPGGTGLDSEIRWQILLRLTVLGAAGRPEIAAAAEQDVSAAGRESAARCRAAIGEQAAKQAAWTTMFESGGTSENESSGYLLTATAQGFWQADQAELLAGYVPRYFPALGAAAARRGTAIARVLCQHGFPSHAVNAAALQAGQQFLAASELTTALRRLLADQLDDLRRSLQVSLAQQALPGSHV
jgi:aminopeptidase N